MRTLFTGKPGRTIGLFLLLGIVALQWSFTTAVRGLKPAVSFLADTSATPVTGKAVARGNKPASSRPNRSTTSSKPVLASNLQRETISFGSPTEGPDSDAGTSSRKKNTTASTKATGAKTPASTGTTNSKSTGADNTRGKTDPKTPPANSERTGGTGANIVREVSTGVKSKSTTNEKAIPANREQTDGTGANIVREVSTGVKSKSTTNVRTAVANSEQADGTDANISKELHSGTKSKSTANAKGAGSNALVDKTRTGTSNASTATKSKGTVNARTAPTNDLQPDELGILTSNIVREVSADAATSKRTTATSTSNKNTAPAKTGTAATKRTANKNTAVAKTGTATATAKTSTASTIGILAGKMIVYDSLRLKQAGLSKKVFMLALTGMSKLVSGHHIKDNLLTIVDYSQPSNKKRLYVIDLNNYQLLYQTYVAHGMNTGRQTAQSFSNKPSSNKSSLGFFITGPAYNGINGYSLKLTGVEKGINDRALERGIVIHGADYVCEGLIESQGFIGRSWGCPSVAPEVSQELIDLLKGGSCLFMYHPSPIYKAKSTFLN